MKVKSEFLRTLIGGEIEFCGSKKSGKNKEFNKIIDTVIKVFEYIEQLEDENKRLKEKMRGFGIYL